MSPASRQSRLCTGTLLLGRGRDEPLEGHRGCWGADREGVSAAGGRGSRGISSSAPGRLRAAARGAGRRGACCSLSSDVSLRCPNLGARGSVSTSLSPSLGPSVTSPAWRPPTAHKEDNCPPHSPSPATSTCPCGHHRLHVTLSALPGTPTGRRETLGAPAGFETPRPRAKRRNGSKRDTPGQRWPGRCPHRPPVPAPA